MTYICKGTKVKDASNHQGTVISIDPSSRSIVFLKENGGVTACPVNMVEVVSYKEVM